MLSACFLFFLFIFIRITCRVCLLCTAQLRIHHFFTSPKMSQTNHKMRAKKKMWNDYVLCTFVRSLDWMIWYVFLGRKDGYAGARTCEISVKICYQTRIMSNSKKYSSFSFRRRLNCLASEYWMCRIKIVPMMMMMMEKSRVCWVLNNNASSNNETNYFMRVIDDYWIACCTHFTTGCVPDK